MILSYVAQNQIGPMLLVRKKSDRKPRAVIFKFVSYNTRKKNSNKKQLEISDT